MTRTMEIATGEVEAIVGGHHGNRVFAEVLRGAVSPAALVHVLDRYVQFNSVFGAGAASLAGQLALRQDLFRDLAEPVTALSDRSAEVAAPVFCAAIDEFGDPTEPHRPTHRALAQAMLVGIAEALGFSAPALVEMLVAHAPTLHAMRRVREGYGLVGPGGERRLFCGIGFHIGSELLADREFAILDAFLRDRYPDLVERMRVGRVQWDGHALPPYVWVAIHTTVEAEHLQLALVAARRALRYYAGAELRDRVHGWILEGCREFMEVQTEFMEGLRH